MSKNKNSRLNTNRNQSISEYDLFNIDYLNPIKIPLRNYDQNLYQKNQNSNQQNQNSNQQNQKSIFF